jgi:hypothetical protein
LVFHILSDPGFVVPSVEYSIRPQERVKVPIQVVSQKSYRYNDIEPRSCLSSLGSYVCQQKEELSRT